MAKYAYEERKFKKSSLELIQMVNSVVDDYIQQGYKLTVRQIYYQLVAKAYIPNNLQSYKRVAVTINDGKMAGLVDWDAIEDRTREFITRNHFNNAGHLMRNAVHWYHEDMWQNQDQRVVVIIEKEALVGVLEKLCRQYDVPLLAARGYPSGSVLREFAIDYLNEHVENGQRIKIIHLGDHDPSGIDMTRDLRDRFQTFTHHAWGIDLHRIALNMEQIEELNPPENPAKSTDSRFEQYLREYGESSWELDALSPKYINNLVESHIQESIDEVLWEQMEQKIQLVKDRILEVSRTI